MTAWRRDQRRRERLHNIDRRERRDTEGARASDTARQDRELRNAADEDERHAGNRGRAATEQRRKALREVPGGECRGWIGDQVSAGWSDKARDTRCANRSEHRQSSCTE